MTQRAEFYGLVGGYLQAVILVDKYAGSDYGIFKADADGKIVSWSR